MADFPKKDRRRAKRRFLKQRMKKKARWLSKYVWSRGRWSRPGWDNTDKDVKLADNLAFCDRWCCQNPRKTLKEKTLQEKKADLDMKDQVSFQDVILDKEYVDNILGYYYGNNQKEHLTSG